MKKLKFNKRYVLGEGYPWAMGMKIYTSVALVRAPKGVELIPLDFPIDLWSSAVPRYRLVLEQVKEQP